MQDRSDDGGPLARPAGSRALLVTGVVLGIALAAVGTVLDVDPPGVPADAVATVNGVAISADRYERTLAGLAQDKRSPLDDADRAHVLARLVEEELLVQRGVEIGLLTSEPRVRKAVVAEMIQAIVADAESREPSDAEVRAFFEEHRDYFVASPRLRVRRLAFRARGPEDDPGARAAEAAGALRAGAGEADVATLADAPVVPLPDALLPPRKLQEYLGPSAVEALEARPVGAWSDPVPVPGGALLLLVVERDDPEPPRYEDVRAHARAEYRRRAGDRELRASLDQLRRAAELRYAAGAPR